MQTLVLLLPASKAVYLELALELFYHVAGDTSFTLVERAVLRVSEGALHHELVGLLGYLDFWHLQEVRVGEIAKELRGDWGVRGVVVVVACGLISQGDDVSGSQLLQLLCRH